MAKLQDIKRIDKNDFPEEFKGLVESLAFILNPLMEDLIFAFNKNIDFDNLRQEQKDIEITVDSNGFPTMDTIFKNNLNTRISNILVGKVDNLTNSNSYANYPMIYWEENAKLVKIKNVQGLSANNKYKIRILTIGT